MINAGYDINQSCFGWIKKVRSVSAGATVFVILLCLTLAAYLQTVSHRQIELSKSFDHHVEHVLHQLAMQLKTHQIPLKTLAAGLSNATSGRLDGNRIAVTKILQASSISESFPDLKSLELVPNEEAHPLAPSHLNSLLTPKTLEKFFALINLHDAGGSGELYPHLLPTRQDNVIIKSSRIIPWRPGAKLRLYAPLPTFPPSNGRWVGIVAEIDSQSLLQPALKSEHPDIETQIYLGSASTLALQTAQELVFDSHMKPGDDPRSLRNNIKNIANISADLDRRRAPPRANIRTAQLSLLGADWTLVFRAPPDTFAPKHPLAHYEYLLFAGLILSTVIAYLVSAVGFANSRYTKQDPPPSSNLLFTHAPSALILTDSSDIIRQANADAYALFDYPPDSLIGTAIRVLIPDKALMYTAEKHDNVRGGTIDAEVKACKGSGETFNADIRYKSVAIDGITHTLIAVTDATYHKFKEHTLTTAKAQAEQNSQAKSDFVASMSHEIRTPLNAVIGSAQLLEKTDTDIVQRQYIHMIRSAGEALLAVINDILDFSKLESGQLALLQIPFALEEVITRVAALMPLNIGEKSVIPVIDIDPDLPSHFTGDALRLQQIVINLVSNAIKFTKSGEVVLALTTGTAQPAGPAPSNFDSRIESQQEPNTEPRGHSVPISKALNQRLHISVRDTGIGIKPGQLKNLFKEFSQANDSITSRFGGTGLGLFISSKLVGLMGSKINVDSTFEKGTSFSFEIELPIAGTRVSPSPRWSAPPRVLIIESHVPSVTALRNIMKPHTGNIVVHDSIDQFTASTRDDKASSTFDWVILDWATCQPEPGLKMLIQRLHTSNDALRIIITCAGAAQQSEALSHNLLPDERVLLKPFTPTLFIKRLMGYNMPLNPATQPTAAGPRIQGVLKPGLTVLVVDDTIFNQTIAAQMLEDMGITCELASNGREAIEHYKQNAANLDLILMDIQMPIMDGLTATQQLREHHHCQVPIIAMTAGAPESDQQHYVKAGITGAIAKPVDITELRNVVARHTTQKPPVNDHSSKQNPVSKTMSNSPPTNVTTTDYYDSTPHPGTKYFDSELLEILINDNADRRATIRSALGSICRDIRRRLKTCDKLFEQQNFSGLHIKIQSIKGLVTNYGGQLIKPLFESLEALCQVLESSSADTEQTVDLTQHKDALRQQLILFKDTMEAYLTDANDWCILVSALESVQPNQDQDQQTVSCPTNADLLAPDVRSDLFEALEYESFEKIQVLLDKLRKLNEETEALANHMTPYLNQRDIDGIVNLLRMKQNSFLSD